MSGSGPAGSVAAFARSAGGRHGSGVVRMSAGSINTSLALIAGIIGVAMIFGIVDLLRQPTWAWRAAREPKLVCLLLVLFLPGVGLAIYVFGARPTVVDIAAHGRAASLPFERFGDQARAAVGSARAVQALARPTIRGSFGETIQQPLRATTAPAGARTGASFFDDPDLVSVGDNSGFLAAGGMATVATEIVDDPAPEQTIHIPGQIGKPYKPRQRGSLDEGSLDSPSRDRVAADIATGAPPDYPRAATTQPVPQPVGAGSVTMGAPAGLLAMAAPRVGTSTPEIFRTRPETVAPIAGMALPTTAPLAGLTARWMNDPTGRHKYRYWDGGHWTENVYDAGVESRDPVST